MFNPLTPRYSVIVAVVAAGAITASAVLGVLLSERTRDLSNTQDTLAQMRVTLSSTQVDAQATKRRLSQSDAQVVALSQKIADAETAASAANDAAEVSQETIDQLRHCVGGLRQAALNILQERYDAASSQVAAVHTACGY